MFRLFFACLIVLIVTNLTPVTAQTPTEDAIIFAWNDTLFAHTVTTSTTTVLGPAFADFAATLPGYDVYTLSAAPITEPPADSYGFQHGMWSPDRTQFAYLEIDPPRYRVRLYNANGETQLLLDEELNVARGYLDPVGWTPEGDIVLLERVLLNHLHTVKTWRLDIATSTLHYFAFVPLERLSGRSALLSDGTTVFLGFNLTQEIGFLLDIPSKRVRSFEAQLGSTLPPDRGFEYYPLQVFSALSTDELATFSAQIKGNNAPTVDSPFPEPFLYWPLPDTARSITCYTDSPWTTANFDVTCPGLSAPRNYVGHEGTDIGGKPGGLTIDTPVYPAAPGVVVATFRECVEEYPNCNNSYGNTITLEHIVIINGTTQVWYTGYGHLHSVLAEDYTYVDDLTEPLALSGATGVGGAHLHFEVRTTDTWVDPWDNRAGSSLWLGSNAHPLSAISVNEEGTIPEVLAVCTSFAGNNIRSGPGTTHDVITQTTDGSTYHVLEITFVGSGTAQGDWYRIRFEGGEGWLWSGLLTCP